MGFKLPKWIEWYKKPSYVDLKKFAASFNEKIEASSLPNSRPSSIDLKSTASIPKKLALERILKNKTCSPMSLFDFYMYLKYIELSPENLEFYMWFNDYETRYAKEMGDVHIAKLDEASYAGKDAPIMSVSEVDSMKSQTLKEKPSLGGRTESTVNLVDDSTETYNESLVYIESLISQSAPCAAPNFSKYGAANNPFTTYASKASAFNAELASISGLFLVPGSQKELNIPSGMRKSVLKTIAVSPDPANLEPVATHVYTLLKSCSHRNFVRLGVSNGTFETVCMATGLGLVLTVAGFLTMILLAFASPSYRHSNRWHSLAVIPMWSIGTSLIMSGMRGSCFFLLLFSRRQPLPWERFDDDASVNTKRSAPMKFMKRLMIMDRKVRVKDVNLRNLQKKIVLQSIAAGVVFTVIMEVFFLTLPIWRPIK